MPYIETAYDIMCLLRLTELLEDVASRKEDGSWEDSEEVKDYAKDVLDELVARGVTSNTDPDDLALALLVVVSKDDTIDVALDLMATSWTPAKV